MVELSQQAHDEAQAAPSDTDTLIGGLGSGLAAAHEFQAVIGDLLAAIVDVRSSIGRLLVAEMGLATACSALGRLWQEHDGPCQVDQADLGLALPELVIGVDAYYRVVQPVVIPFQRGVGEEVQGIKDLTADTSILAAATRCASALVRC